MPTATTPMMEQYNRAKREHPDALLFFRMGDFYELFHEDAVEASKLLGITLTSRSKEKDLPMAGVPVRSLDGYLRKAIERGRRVAICEQMEDPRKTKGIVDRAVVRVVTPGTLTEDAVLDSGRSNFLAAVSGDGRRVGLAWVDVSTGEFFVEETAGDQLGDALGRIDPAELLVAETGALPDLGEALRVEPLAQATWTFDAETGRRALLEQLGTHDLEGFGCDDLGPALGAAGAVLEYLRQTQKTALGHIRTLRRHRADAHLVLDHVTRACLELTETIRERRREGSLLGVLDRTATAMGARRLRHWVLEPLRDVEAIQRRQDAVGELVERTDRRRAAIEALDRIYDLERIGARVSTGRANARDLASLRESLGRLPALRETLAESVSEALVDLRAAIDPLDDLAAKLEAALADDPAIGLKDGGMIRAEWSEELDELRGLTREGKAWIANFQSREIERTGIPTLKVGFNRVFGYYIEISRAQAVRAPDDYTRKQTLKNAERYVTPELKEYETKVLTADERSKELEYDLFVQLRDDVAAELGRIQTTADAVARLDALTSLSRVATEQGYVRPTVDTTRETEIVDGRHPVLEQTLAAGEGFVANDVRLDEREHLLLITGPNMAGKSTYIRQVALLTLLAHMGSFVPAREARIGLTDRIFTRVGAADEITRGRSTFMVEMAETANILNNATDRSLVILDEVGRGTSTYDGVSLAWAITEYVAEKLRCRTLFATHYHEITALAERYPGVKNVSVAVREWGEEIVFLRKIVDGATDRSYGIHVARLAGIPRPVLARAREVLERLENGAAGFEPGPSPGGIASISDPQLSLFAAVTPTPAPLPDPVRAEIEALDLDRMTPIEALLELRRLQERAGDRRTPYSSSS